MNPVIASRLAYPDDPVRRQSILEILVEMGPDSSGAVKTLIGKYLDSNDDSTKYLI